jgi:hypothetical protein
VQTYLTKDITHIQLKGIAREGVGSTEENQNCKDRAGVIEALKVEKGRSGRDIGLTLKVYCAILFPVFSKPLSSSEGFIIFYFLIFS